MLTRLLLVLTLLTSCPTPTCAQKTPKTEVFAGYTYARAGGALGSASYGKNLNGWNTAAVVNVSRWLSIEGDVSGSYGSGRKILQFPASHTSPSATLDARLTTSVHTFTVGPRVSFRSGRVTMYGHSLVGAAKVSQSDEGTYSFLSTPGPHVAGQYDDTSFAMLAGGGVSFRATKSVAVRLVQVDYLMTRFATPNDEHLQNGFRVSAGIVFTFGQR